MIDSSVSLAHELDPKRWSYLGLYKAPPFANWFWAAAWSDPRAVEAAGFPSGFLGYISVNGGHVSWSRDALTHSQQKKIGRPHGSPVPS